MDSVCLLDVLTRIRAVRGHGDFSPHSWIADDSRPEPMAKRQRNVGIQSGRTCLGRLFQPVKPAPTPLFVVPRLEPRNTLPWRLQPSFRIREAGASGAVRSRAGALEREEVARRASSACCCFAAVSHPRHNNMHEAKIGSLLSMILSFTET